jgi:hypothetical protein
MAVIKYEVMLWMQAGNKKLATLVGEGLEKVTRGGV